MASPERKLRAMTLKREDHGLLRGEHSGYRPESTLALKSLRVGKVT